MSIEAEMSTVRIKAAIAANQQQRKMLMDGSIGDQSGLADGLAPFRNARIRVYQTKPNLIKEISINPKAIGTVMRNSAEYLIFVDKKGDLELQSIWGNFTHRFVVLHEYAHIIHGDVFEDKSDAEKVILLTFSLERLNEYWSVCDDFANKYATDRLHSEIARYR